MWRAPPGAPASPPRSSPKPGSRMSHGPRISRASGLATKRILPKRSCWIAGLLDRRASEIDALLTDALDAVRDALEAEEVTHVPIQTTVTVTAAQAPIAAVPKTGTSRAIPATPGVAGSRVRDVRLVKIRKTDHYARLAAVKRLIELATAGRSLPRAADAAEAQLATLEQLETLVELSQRTQ